MDHTSFASAVVVFLLVMDPLGNIPLFVSLLRNVEASRREDMQEAAVAAENQLDLDLEVVE